MKYFMIDEDQLNALRRLATRLHTENRMNGDEMRDAGHTIEGITRIVEQIEIPDENITT